MSTDPLDSIAYKDAIFDCLAGLFSSSTMGITSNDYIAEPLSGRFLRLLFAGTLLLDGESLFAADRAEILMFYKAFHSVLFNFGNDVGRAGLFCCPICMSGGSCQCSRISWPKVPFGFSQRFLQASWYSDFMAEVAAAKPSSPAELRSAFESVLRRFPNSVRGDEVRQNEFRHIEGYMDQMRHRLSSPYYSRPARGGTACMDDCSGYHPPDLDTPAARLSQTPNKGAQIFRQACYDSILCDRASLLAEEMLHLILGPELLVFRHRQALLEVYSCAFGLTLVRRGGASITACTPGMPYLYAQHYCKMSDMLRQALREATVCNRPGLSRILTDQQPEDAANLGLLLQTEFPSNKSLDLTSLQECARAEGRKIPSAGVQPGQKSRPEGLRSVLRFGGFVLGAVEGGNERWGGESEAVQAGGVARDAEAVPSPEGDQRETAGARTTSPEGLKGET